MEKNYDKIIHEMVNHEFTNYESISTAIDIMRQLIFQNKEVANVLEGHKRAMKAHSSTLQKQSETLLKQSEALQNQIGTITEQIDVISGNADSILSVTKGMEMFVEKYEDTVRDKREEYKKFIAEYFPNGF